MDEPSYRCFTKASRREAGPPRLSANWLVSRRDWFRIHQDRVACGDWVIPVADIEGAVLYRARQGWITAPVLELRTEGDTYQFGFNPWVRVADHLPFEVSHQVVRLRYSTFSTLVRVALITYLCFLLVRWLA